MLPSVHHPAAWALLILGLVAIFIALLLIRVRKSTAKKIYRRHVAENIVRERLLFASTGFCVTFAGIRYITHAIRAGRGPFHDVSVGGRHIHHLVWGILLLLLVGYCWLWQVSLRAQAYSRVLSLIYGVGAALTLDEFALWLNLQDVYWERQGRESIDAVLLFSALLAMGIFGGGWLRAMLRAAAGKAPEPATKRES